MENNYIKNGNNRVENPCLTPCEGKKRVRRGEEESKKSLRRGREVAWRAESRVKAGLKQGLRLKVLRVAVVLGVMILMPFAGWGQRSDLSGYWFFANCNSDNGNTGYQGYYSSANYYMRPAEYWYNYNGTTANFTNDNGKPFITTYYTNQDEESSLWLVEKVEGQTYYTIQHVSSGKYLTVNDALSGYPATRMRVHLETLSVEYLTGRNYFYIDEDNVSTVIASYNIRCLDTYANGNNKCLNPAKGNKNQLTPTSDGNNAGGMIGFYETHNNGSRWVFEEVKPRISFTADDKVQISYPYYPSNATIYYTFTTDGTPPANPTTFSAVYNEPFPIIDANASQITVKAFAVRTIDNYQTEITTFTSHVLPGSTRPYLFNNLGFGTTPHVGFYMQPDTYPNTNNEITVTTSSVGRPLMKWYFKSAGIDNGYQYFYIINSEFDSYPYLYCTTDGSTGIIRMKTATDFDESDKYKFRIVIDSPGNYRVVPKIQQTKWLNKSYGNNDNRAVNTIGTVGELAGCWNLIPIFDNQMPASTLTPFTVSDNTTVAYYNIFNANDNTYYIVPGATTNAYATTSNTSSDGAWYFKVAGSDNWLTYYNIVNAISGKYLYFCPSDIPTGPLTSTINNAFQTLDYSSENADRYQFVVANTTESDPSLGGKFYLVPKVLKDVIYNNYALVWRDGTNALKVHPQRADNKRKWTFTQTTFHCAQPEISYNATLNGYVITPVESDASIYYLIGDGELTPSTGTLLAQGTAISVADLGVETTSIRAIAARSIDGSDASDEATQTVNRVATPGFELTDDGRVRLTCETGSVDFYYEMGANPSDPSTSSTHYTGPIDGAAGLYIKAIAVKGGWINSAVATSEQITFSCATPVIRKTSATTFTITCDFPTSGVRIYYETGVDPEHTPTPSNSSLNSISSGEAVTFDPTDLPFTVKAIAYADGYNPSAVATQPLTRDLTQDPVDDYYIIATDDDFGTFVSMVNENTINAGAKYKITADINASSAGVIDQNPFTGELKSVAKADGSFPVVSNLSHAIFNTVNGGVVHNIMLKSISVGGSGNVGAICNEARGYTRIYNCGILPTTADFPNGSHSTVTATGAGNCAGGIVGLLSDDSRVVNCFSYADVSSGGYAAGIVGNNTFASTAEVENVSGVDKYTHLRTMVVNCMFYGNVTSGSSIWPVYGGTKILNTGATAINNYNFYSVGCTFSSTLTDYNCSWPAQIDYLTRYEFHRNLLNSNRELCGWWVGAATAPSTMSTAEVQAVPKDASLMAKWVLDPAVAPYPILKSFGKYSSPVNIDADAAWRINANKWEGKKLGTLNVTVNPGSQHTVTQNPELEIVITDMDTLRGDYCYKKIQLPYYNTVFGNPNGATWAEKYGDNYGDYVVIGWKVSTSEGTAGTLTENWQTGYNFADRNCTAKDANRVFAQGGYYYVPNGVNNITITAQWAHAVYFDNTDHSYDRVYMSGSKPGTDFAPAGYRPSTLGNGKTVLSNNLKELADNSSYIGANVYEYAVVLVGNHQYRHHVGDASDNIGSSSGGFTVISSDFDFDEEPDHCLIWQLGKRYDRKSFCPIRFDFLPIVEIGLAMKEDGSTQYYSLGCYRPLGHFEVTETSLIRFGQFEFSNKNRTVYAPLILNAGIYEQYCKGTNNYAFNDADDKINYIILGGNVRMPSFTPGAHVNTNANKPTRHCAVNVIGGSIDNLYLTGNYNDNVTPNTDNPHCYIDGCRIKHVAAAGKEGINGDVYFKINHSKIWEFYGGSTMDQSSGDNFKTVKGNIDVTIDSSIVIKYCGGPKFGDMVYYEANPANSKTITTRATGTTFTYYYGGGNGGTSYVQYDKTDVTGNNGISTGTYNWNGTGNNQGHLNNYNPGAYRSGDNNYMADYDMEIVNTSAGTEPGEAVCRTYFYAAQFSATNTGPISNTLTGCKVLKNFYGAGNLGGVYGDVTSELTDTKVDSLAFGAGFSASIPQVTIYNRDKTPPTIDIHTGIITPQSGGTKTTYTWTNETSLGGTSLSTNSPAVLNPNGDGINYFFTTISLQNLGTVSGNVTLTIKGSSVIGTEGEANTGNVYGGGDQSTVTHNTTVKLQGSAHVLGNVYGGGNEGEVSGNSSVTIEPEP